MLLKRPLIFSVILFTNSVIICTNSLSVYRMPPKMSNMSLLGWILQKSPLRYKLGFRLQQKCHLWWDTLQGLITSKEMQTLQLFSSVHWEYISWIYHSLLSVWNKQLFLQRTNSNKSATMFFLTPCIYYLEKIIGVTLGVTL